MGNNKSERSNGRLELPTMLAFERKLEVSDALMYAGVWGDGENPEVHQEWEKIAIIPRLNRSTISAYNTKDGDKAKPNPVAAENDDANLPAGRDTLKVSFTLRIVSGLGQPFACNSPDFEKAIVGKVEEYTKDGGSGGLTTLAQRYAYNIANGRFLWRNRVCAERIVIHAQKKGENEPLVFNALDFDLNRFEKNRECKKLKGLAEIVRQGLAGDVGYVFLTVNAYVQLGDKQHVFPSQEMNMGEKKKVLFSLDNCAAIHNVKIGNALRTIDTWYNDQVDFPIAVEPFGAVTQRGEAFRKSKNDLYTLMADWVNGRELGINAASYIVANLIRGGVFGGKSE